MSSCKNLHQCVTECADAAEGLFPSQVSGVKGSLNGFFIGQFIERVALNEIHAMQYEQKHSQWQKDYVIVVATQKDADECESDLNTILGDDVEVYKLPWWGTIPYRPINAGTAIKSVIV